MLTSTQWDVLRSDDWGEVEDWLADGSLSPEVCQEFCIEAARYDCAHILHLLLKAKIVDLEMRQRALLCAINGRCFTAMHLLLQNGCDSNYRYRTGTPLHCALSCELNYGLVLEDLTGKVLRHITQSIELILKYNPDPTIVDDGRTPRELALWLGQFAAADLLAAYEQSYAAPSATP